MPSKPLTALMILFVAGGVYASMMIDRTRDVPPLPPEFARMAAGGGEIFRPERPGLPVAGAPDAGTPGAGGNGGAAAPAPAPEEEDTAGEVRISNVELQGVESEATRPVRRGEGDELAVITIGAEGELLWNGFAVGSYQMLFEMFENNAGKDIVIVPDANVPWQYVHWAFQVAREGGATTVSLGCYPTTDREHTLLARINSDVMAGAPTEELGDAMEPIPVKVMTDDEDNVVYIIMGETASGPSELYQKASPLNSEYASFFTAEYARKAGNTPWVVQPEGDVPAGKVLRAIGALRLSAVYAVRLEGDYGTPPGMNR